MKKSLIIALIIVSILIIIFVLRVMKKIENEDTTKVISYIQTNKEENNKTNDLLSQERIIVSLPIKKEKTDKTKEQNMQTDKHIEENRQTGETNTTIDNKPNINSGKNYYIRVNNEANVVTIFTKDNEGKYTVPIKAMICSTGTATPTSGTYEIKLRWEWLGLFGNVYGHYSTQIVGNILFHSVPYLEKGNPSSLEYWEYDKLGTSCSAGCVRLTVADAKWIYDNVETGSVVEFYSSPNPGPLRKTIYTKNIGK